MRRSCRAIALGWRAQRARIGTRLQRDVPLPNDNIRTGQKLAESVLTPSTVTASQFGLLFTDAIDAAAYAQPLSRAERRDPGHGHAQRRVRRDGKRQRVRI